MKTKYNLLKTITVVMIFSFNSWSQATIAQWNFNGTSATTIPGGESAPTPFFGAGTAQLIGGVTASFSSGNATPGTLETETNSPPNFGWQTTNYAPLGTDNKLRGVQFNVSTINQEGITFKFEQRLSNTANNTYVVQYTSDRTSAIPVWVDAQTFTFTPAATGTGDTWYNGRIVDLSAVIALNNNPNVAFRIVSAYDPSTNNYLAARSTSTYAGGTVRFDMVTVTSTTTLGVTQFQNVDNEFLIYPNPSNKEIVHFSQPHDVKVYNSHGKLINAFKNVSSINTATLTSGIYFIKFDGITKKLIIK